MLAGERFSDHPQAVCPVLAGLLRSYNDLKPEEQLPAARHAFEQDPAVRRTRVMELLEELAAVGRHSAGPAAPAARVERESAPVDADEHALT
jgi:hypothetical protein